MRVLGYQCWRKSEKKIIGTSSDIERADVHQFRYLVPIPTVIRHNRKKRTPARILLIKPPKNFSPMTILMRSLRQLLPLTEIFMMSLVTPPIKLPLKH